MNCHVVLLWCTASNVRDTQVKWGPGDPLIRYKNLAEPPEPEDFTMEDVNMKGDSDLLLRVGPTAEELVSIRLHKDIMAAHSAVVAGMLSNQQYDPVICTLLFRCKPITGRFSLPPAKLKYREYTLGLWSES
jgi:hypothetical protein